MLSIHKLLLQRQLNVKPSTFVSNNEYRSQARRKMSWSRQWHRNDSTTSWHASFTARSQNLITAVLLENCIDNNREMFNSLINENIKFDVCKLGQNIGEKNKISFDNIFLGFFSLIWDFVHILVRVCPGNVSDHLMEGSLINENIKFDICKCNLKGFVFRYRRETISRSRK